MEEGNAVVCRLISGGIVKGLTWIQQLLKLAQGKPN